MTTVSFLLCVLHIKMTRFISNILHIFLALILIGAIFHVYQAPVVVTILVGMNANLGAIRSTAIPLLKGVLEPLCTELLNSLSPARDWQDADHPYPQQGYYQ